MRYIVLEIDCIECNFDFGSSLPEVRMMTDDIEEAEASYRSRMHDSSFDVVILDTANSCFGRAEYASKPLEWRASTPDNPARSE